MNQGESKGKAEVQARAAATNTVSCVKHRQQGDTKRAHSRVQNSRIGEKVVIGGIDREMHGFEGAGGGEAVVALAVLVGWFGVFGVVFPAGLLLRLDSWQAETAAPTYFVPGKESGFAIVANDTARREKSRSPTRCPRALRYGRIRPVRLVGFRLRCDLNIVRSSTLLGVWTNGNLPSRATFLFGTTTQIEPEQLVRAVISVDVSASAAEGPVTNEATVEGGGLTARRRRHRSWSVRIRALGLRR